MKIRVKSLKETIWEIEIEGRETVYSLKLRIQQLSNDELKANEIRLIYGAQILTDENTLQSYNIDESRVVIIMRATFLNQNQSDDNNNNDDDDDDDDAGEEDAIQQIERRVQCERCRRPEHESGEASSSTSSLQEPAQAASISIFENEFLRTEYESITDNREVMRIRRIVMTMGYSFNDVAEAFRIAYNNPNRAMEYLITGWPLDLVDDPDVGFPFECRPITVRNSFLPAARDLNLVPADYSPPVLPVFVAIQNRQLIQVLGYPNMHVVNPLFQPQNVRVNARNNQDRPERAQERPLNILQRPYENGFRTNGHLDIAQMHGNIQYLPQARHEIQNYHNGNLQGNNIRYLPQARLARSVSQQNLQHPDLANNNINYNNNYNNHHGIMGRNLNLNMRYNFRPINQPENFQRLSPFYPYRNNVHFVNLVRLFQLHSERLDELTSELWRSNPAFIRFISQNRYHFLNILNNRDPDFAVLNDLEWRSIDRLEAQGFERYACISAFLTCERNEDLALNYLVARQRQL